MALDAANLIPRRSMESDFTTAEFSDRASLARAIEGAEYVFHLLAGSTPESSNRDPVADLEFRSIGNPSFVGDLPSSRGA